MITNFYIDAFNLYYGCLKNTPHKWLNSTARLYGTRLCRRFLWDLAA
jgi:hypothetical protein